MTSPALGESRIIIDENETGSRLDRVLLRHTGDIGRGLVLRLIRRGNVRVNGKRCKPGHRLASGDCIYVPASLRAGRGQAAVRPDSLPLLDKRINRMQVIYEDDMLLALNKPAGMVVHGGSGHRQGLIEGLRTQRGNDALQLAHRLDRDTSGVLLLAKNLKTLRELTSAFRQRDAHKTYFAWVAGHPYPTAGRFSSQLRKGNVRGGERMVTVGEGGAVAVTDYQLVLQACRNDWLFSLVALQPLSGRTHQLRVQLQDAGHAILGDGKYGEREDNRLFKDIGGKGMALHAWRLRFVHPASAQPLEIRAPWPEWWSECFASDSLRLCAAPV
ncbi:MAG: RluA family pseudouridine synthase [Mariprofundaceae bacterium]